MNQATFTPLANAGRHAAPPSAAPLDVPDDEELLVLPEEPVLVPLDVPLLLVVPPADASSPVVPPDDVVPDDPLLELSVPELPPLLVLSPEVAPVPPDVVPVEERAPEGSDPGLLEHAPVALATRTDIREPRKVREVMSPGVAIGSSGSSKTLLGGTGCTLVGVPHVSPLGLFGSCWTNGVLGRRSS